MFNRPRLVYLVEYGHEEGGGLAGAGLRARHHVALPQHYGDRVLLHRRRLVVACVRYVRAHYFRQVNVLELYVTNEKYINKSYFFIRKYEIMISVCDHRGEVTVIAKVVDTIPLSLSSN